MPILTEEERIGTTLGGRYELERILGRGGMGVVYDARHVYTGRRVAVKLMRPEVSEDPRRGERLVREAQAAAALDHDGIVDVLDMGEADGCLYLALERLFGRDLADELASRETLPPGEAVAITLAVLSALAAAHAANIVHRDVKPSNVFLARRGDCVVPKLLDFGIAKVSDASFTTTGAILGTPHYMSPEAVGGDTEPSPAMDVWSAAVVLYECLCGSPPFVGPTPTAVLMNVLRGDFAPLSLPGASATADVVARALRRPRTADEVDERFLDASSFAAALERAAEADGLSLALPSGEGWDELPGDAAIGRGTLASPLALRRGPSDVAGSSNGAAHGASNGAAHAAVPRGRRSLEEAPTIDTGSGRLPWSAGPSTGATVRPPMVRRRWLALGVGGVVSALAVWLMWPERDVAHEVPTFAAQPASGDASAGPHATPSREGGGLANAPRAETSELERAGPVAERDEPAMPLGVDAREETSSEAPGLAQGEPRARLRPTTSRRGGSPARPEIPEPAAPIATSGAPAGMRESAMVQDRSATERAPERSGMPGATPRVGTSEGEPALRTRW